MNSEQWFIWFQRNSVLSAEFIHSPWQWLGLGITFIWHPLEHGMGIIQSCSNHRLNLYRLQVINITAVLLRLHATQTPVRQSWKSLQIIGWDVHVLKWLLFPIPTSSGHWLLILPVVICEDQPKHWLQRHWHFSWRMALSWQDPNVLFINEQCFSKKLLRLFTAVQVPSGKGPVHSTGTQTRCNWNPTAKRSSLASSCSHMWDCSLLGLCLKLVEVGDSNR